MQKEINEFAAKLADLDTFTQRSVLGSWSFFINSQCINQGVRALPDVPDEGEGIDGYTPWEGAIRTAQVKLSEQAQTEGGDMQPTLPAWIALHRYVSHMMTETGGDPSTVLSTYEFLSEKGPTRERFEADFAMRVKMGMRPGISRKDFVDGEYQRALDQHQRMLAKGEHAVQLIERLTLATSGQVERGFDDLPEWVLETLQQKLVQKLKDRWTRLEIQRTNPRVNVQNRDAAEGDQLLIREALKSFDEDIEIPVVEDDES